MQPASSNGVSVQSTLTGQEFKMGIDESAMAHIMSILTDLYGDPELAIIREYSTNAWDAHVEAGITRAIEIETPTALRQLLVIRDFGIGLSVDDIHNIYSRYGASTKRNTNTQVGMLGLGCKSALTYTHQFTLVSNKDGVKSHVSISRDDSGGGSMNVVDTSATTDPNGTEIWIPIKQVNQIEKKAQEFFSYWPKDRVLLNGKPPASLDGLRIGKDYIVTEKYNESKLVMGGVPYPATDELSGLVNGNSSVVAFVPIGDLVFTPSREALQDVPTTQATIKRVRDDFNKQAKGAIQTAINKAPSHREAVRTMLKWHKILPSAARADVYTFKGEDLPTRVVPNQRQLLVRHNSYRQHSHEEVQDLAMDIYIDAVWIHGYDRPNFTVGQKKKIVQWASNRYDATKQMAPQNYILQMGQPDLRFVDAANVVDWDTIKQIVLPRSRTTLYGAPARLTGSFDCYIDGKSCDQKPADTISQGTATKPLFYMVGNRYSARNYSSLLHHFYPNYTLVYMPANREAKFKRDFPKAQKAHESAKALYSKWLKSWSKDHRLALAAHDTSPRLLMTFKDIDGKKVLDPELKAASRLPAINLTKMLEQRSLYQTVLGRRIGSDVTWTNPLAKYPLFEERAFRTYKSHVYDYLNDAYKRQTKGA